MDFKTFGGTSSKALGCILKDALDLSRAHRVADKLDVGNIWINSYNLIPSDWPFGGVKQSGFGRESSVFALESYSQVKATYINY